MGVFPIETGIHIQKSVANNRQLNPALVTSPFKREAVSSCEIQQISFMQHGIVNKYIAKQS
jgi:hypothetical protein